jgi:medium-chain acyl-[acyl-carrier-protein] hydrolase
MTQSTSAPAFDSWISFRKPSPEARLRLFCFPYAGAGALIFRNWQDCLPADVEVCPIQLPGRGTRMAERPFTELPPLVEALATALHPLLDKPFAFFGHSLGALVSFELARRIRGQYDVYPVWLLVSAGRAPQVLHRGPPIHRLPTNEFVTELRRLNGTPSELLDYDELMEIILPLLRADFAIYETYVYSTGPPLNCPISVFGGLEDRAVNKSDLEAWRAQTSGVFSVRMFPGDHFFLKQPLFFQALSQELERSR